MRSLKLSVIFLLLVLSSGILVNNANSQTVGVWYQPTPMPANRTPHIVCGWVPSQYYGQAFKPSISSMFLQTGGWGDWYKIYCKFDLEGMPQNVTNASLWFMPYAKLDGSTTVDINWYKVNEYWDSSMTWGNQPKLTMLFPKGVGTPVPGQRWGASIPNTYNEWTSSIAQAFQSTTAAGYDWRNIRTANNGIFLAAKGNNNNLDLFRSTNYADYAANPLADGDRPGWYIEFPRPINEPDFKMPLPGGGTCDPRNASCIPGTEKRLYEITTEIGGYDCSVAGYDEAHKDIGLAQFNYFSLDIVGTKYSTFTGTPGGKIPILASASGWVDFIGRAPNGVPGYPNGNYMVIRHWNKGTNYSAIPGYSTMYVHVDPIGWPYKDDGTLWNVGDTIYQGDRIGYMGTTGIDSKGVPTSKGVHLHFAIRYGDYPFVAGTTKAGAKNIPQLTNATMEGFLFKSYQTECDSSGTRIRYYQSSNRWYK